MRYGNRLRARHGGAKRHIRFDDYVGSLYTNVKLPGDINWTKVTRQMAKADLEVSKREEDTFNQKHLASKLVPGPRERLRRPAIKSREVWKSGGGGLGAAAGRPLVAGPSDGKQPRWTVPDRRPTSCRQL